ncbi:MAG: reverse transcriptase domain-containing protein, partial [Candidatus Tisiphia sp.]
MHFGIFPNVFKTAKVFPLFKSNDVKDKNNFRPISLLSVFSKVLERVIKEQLIAFLQENHILCNNQYGFRQDLNISDSLFDVCKYLKYSSSENCRTMLVFLDLKKAFDSVDRDKLLLKLGAVGIRGTAHAW